MSFHTVCKNFAPVKTVGYNRGFPSTLTHTKEIVGLGAFAGCR
jgi:hypothetical protein